MIDFLRRLFGFRRPDPRWALLSERLALAHGAPPKGRVRESRKYKRLRAFVVERSAGDVEASPASLDELLEELSASLSEDQCDDLAELVVAASAPDLEHSGGITLAASLKLVRDRLHRRLPAPEPSLTAPHRLNVDLLLGIDERSVWALGWCRDEDGTLTDVDLVSPEGVRVKLLPDLDRFRRPDVEEEYATAGTTPIGMHGFSGLLTLPYPTFLNEGWTLELRGTAADFDAPVRNLRRDPTEARNHIVQEASARRLGIEELRRNHARPAIERLHAYLRPSIGIDQVVQHGDPPASPDVSVIVPLYGRIDLVEHQIAHFWNDSDLCAAEVIFVLDSPELGRALVESTAALHELYGLPVKVVRLSRNGGYSIANNIGASVARGRLLLLLNSDVIPDHQGWLGAMKEFYDSTPGIGALGPKLLFEDDSLQHAGMYFQFDHRTDVWENQHYFKGFSRTLPEARVSRPVPAVTAACMMIERDLYESVGGLHEGYVQGGYEDSDLCLRVIEAGRQNWYLADVELYHLEAQSLPIHARHTTVYNAWLQTHLWHEHIAAVMAAAPEVPDTRQLVAD
jgi:GT2 family glycosyltransferase